MRVSEHSEGGGYLSLQSALQRKLRVVGRILALQLETWV